MANNLALVNPEDSSRNTNVEGFAFYQGFGTPNAQMKNNLQKVKQMQKAFAQAGYHIDPEVAFEVTNWFHLNIQPLLVQGGPGTGKTELAKVVAATTGLKYYRFQCFPGVEAKDVLYWWNEQLQNLLVKTAYQGGKIDISEIKKLIYSPDCRIDGVFARALLDPRPSLIHLDELDKAGDKFEASLLQVSAEGKITISETNDEIISISGIRPRIVFTSNAGVHGMKEAHSQPLLRRSKFIALRKPSIARQYCVLREKFPDLPEALVKACVIFSYQVDEFVRMDKPLDLSEVINWMHSLRETGSTKLSWETIVANIGDLAKSDLDRKNLLASVDTIFLFIRENAGMDIRELSARVEKTVAGIKDWRKRG